MQWKCQAHWLQFDFLDGRLKVDGRFTEPFPCHLYRNVIQEPLARALPGDTSCVRLKNRWLCRCWQNRRAKRSPRFEILMMLLDTDPFGTPGDRRLNSSRCGRIYWEHFRFFSKYSHWRSEHDETFPVPLLSVPNLSLQRKLPHDQAHGNIIIGFMIFSMLSPDPQRINCDDLVTSWLKNIKPHSSSISVAITLSFLTCVRLLLPMYTCKFPKNISLYEIQTRGTMLVGQCEPYYSQTVRLKRKSNKYKKANFMVVTLKLIPNRKTE